MKTIVTIFFILISGIIMGLAVNGKTLLPGSGAGQEVSGACEQKMIKGDPFEVFGIPQIEPDI